MPKERSAAFPSYTIEQCIEYALKFYIHFGDASYIPPEQMGQPIGRAAPTVRQIVSSCIQYGLIEKKHGQGYKPSSVIPKLRTPFDEEEALSIRRELFRRPPFYEFILSRYEGRILPKQPEAIKPFVVRDYRITASAADEALSIMYANVDALKLLTEDRVLSFASGPTVTSFVDDALEIIDRVDTPPPPDTPERKANSSQPSFPIALPGSRHCEFSFPADISRKELTHVTTLITSYVEIFLKEEAPSKDGASTTNSLIEQSELQKYE